MIVTGHDAGLARVSLFFACALVLGIAMTLPIGGADMPVVISLYNALTGLAVGFEGFVLDNAAMIIAGTVVGAAGTLLTQLMAKAMNRSLGNVLFANFGETSAAGGGGSTGTQKADRGLRCRRHDGLSQKVIIVPGYGLAVAQAQHKVWELCAAPDRPRRHGALRHPSGRRPHAGAHERAAGRGRRALRSDLGPRRNQCRVRDRRRGADHRRERRGQSRRAHQDKGSPIYGMPILNADKAKNVIVIKRGQGAGIFRHRQCAVRARSDPHALRRCAGRGRPADPGGEGGRVSSKRSLTSNTAGGPSFASPEASVFSLNISRPARWRRNSKRT